MREQIIEIVNREQRITFGELCRELNCFSTEEISDAESEVMLISTGQCSVECEECDGKGVQECDCCDGAGSEDCGECSGDGEVTCDYGHQHECPECDGEGDEECSVCGGKGDWTCEDCRGTGSVIEDDEDYGQIQIVGPQSLISSSVLIPRLTGVDGYA